jgi:hypothetical protein
VKSAVVYTRCCSYLPCSKTFQAVISNEPVGNFREFAFAVLGSPLVPANWSAGIPFHKASLPQQTHPVNQLTEIVFHESVGRETRHSTVCGQCRDFLRSRSLVWNRSAKRMWNRQRQGTPRLSPFPPKINPKIRSSISSSTAPTTRLFCLATTSSSVNGLGGSHLAKRVSAGFFINY